jgi:hypothetical protein
VQQAASPNEKATFAVAFSFQERARHLMQTKKPVAWNRYSSRK